MNSHQHLSDSEAFNQAGLVVGASDSAAACKAVSPSATGCPRPLAGAPNSVADSSLVVRAEAVEGFSVKAPLHYDKDNIKVYNCDCMVALRELPSASVDVVLTSPPYNLGNTTGGGFPGKKLGHYSANAGMQKRGGLGKWGGGKLADGYDEYQDAMPFDAYVAWQHEVLRECWRIIKPTGAIYYNHKTRILDGIAVTPLAYNPGLPVRQIVIWARAGGVNFSPAFYLPTHEWILIMAKPDFRLRDKAASGAGDVWYIPQESGTEHPAPFPLALALQVMETTGCKTVLDPFAGSGTTLRAAKDCRRHGIGVEINRQYCEMITRRLSQDVLAL